MLDFQKNDFDYNDFSPSIPAMIVSAQFENKDVTCFVEGIDDQLFWEKILLGDMASHFKIIPLNGIKNLKDREEEFEKIRIESEKSGHISKEFCVLLDKDYNKILKTKLCKTNNFVYTYGYSIENTLSCLTNIHKLIIDLLRITANNSEKIGSLKGEIENYYLNLHSLDKLIAIDILNRKKSTVDPENKNDVIESIRIFPEKIGSILDMKSNLILRSEYLEKIYADAKEKIGEEEIERYRSKIDNPLNYLRGHFYSDYVHQVINLILEKNRGTAKRTTLSKEHFYLLSLEKCSNCNSPCEQKKYYNRKRKKLFKNLNLKA